MHVVITDYIYDDLLPEKSILGGVASIEALGAKRESELLPAIADAAALMVFHEITIGRETLEQLKHCQVICRCGVGYDNLDLEAARALGIPIANVPDYGTEEVADATLGLILDLMRGLTAMNNRLREDLGHWHHLAAGPLFRLRGKTLGILGLGRIGVAVAMRAKAFGLKVAYFDPYISAGWDKALGITKVETLEELLSLCEILSIHCPLTGETRGLIDAAAIEKMPVGSFLVNTARGGIVDPDAVLGALETGHLAGAGLDVLPEEPPSDDEPLVKAWRDPNHPASSKLILTPHAAFYCEEGLEEMRLKAARTCLAALEGRAIPNVVNGVA